MSRIAKKPIVLPEQLTLTQADNKVNIKGPKGELEYPIFAGVGLEVVGEGNERVAQVKLLHSNKQTKALSGTMRALISNMVTGVIEGFKIQLDLVGVGYRAQVQGKKLVMSLGFAHPITYALPDIVKVTMPSNTSIVLESINKQVLGQVAAEIRAHRPPEPYKGKGIRYAGEQIKLKEAKKK